VAVPLNHVSSDPYVPRTTTPSATKYLAVTRVRLALRTPTTHRATRSHSLRTRSPGFTGPPRQRHFAPRSDGNKKGSKWLNISVFDQKKLQLRQPTVLVSDLAPKQSVCYQKPEIFALTRKTITTENISS